MTFHANVQSIHQMRKHLLQLGPHLRANLRTPRLEVSRTDANHLPLHRNPYTLRNHPLRNRQNTRRHHTRGPLLERRHGPHEHEVRLGHSVPGHRHELAERIPRKRIFGSHRAQPRRQALLQKPEDVIPRLDLGDGVVAVFVGRHPSAILQHQDHAGYCTLPMIVYPVAICVHPDLPENDLAGSEQVGTNQHLLARRPRLQGLSRKPPGSPTVGHGLIHTGAALHARADHRYVVHRTGLRRPHVAEFPRQRLPLRWISCTAAVHERRTSHIVETAGQTIFYIHRIYAVRSTGVGHRDPIPDDIPGLHNRLVRRLLDLEIRDEYGQDYRVRGGYGCAADQKLRRVLDGLRPGRQIAAYPDLEGQRIRGAPCDCTG